MSLISNQLPNLMNGVSQQAATMRLPSQCEAQVNALSSVVEGVSKRPPLNYRAKIADPLAGPAFVHTINRDSSERYVVVVEGGAVSITDLDGTAKAVDVSEGTSYLTTADPAADLRAITVADYTFIVNTKQTVAISEEVAEAGPSEALIFVKGVEYDRSYAVYINGTEVASYATASAYATNPVISSDHVRNSLGSQLKTNLGSGWTVNWNGPIIHIVNDNGDDFTIGTADSNGHTLITSFKGEAQRFTDLPRFCVHGMTLRVNGSAEGTTDDFYVRFKAKDENYSEGVWEECAAPAQQHKLDASTMPHTLVRQSDGSFKLQQIEWGDRIVGDEETAPWPSFVGSAIKDVFFEGNRLCFLSDDNVIMSRTGDFFSFFPSTVQTLLDDGPIDVSAAGTKVSILQYAVPFQKRVVVFSDQTQFSLDAEQLLASEPPALKEVTQYQIDPLSKPVAVGKTVYFGVQRGAYSGLMEYYIVPDTETTDAADVTKHVPTYIPRGLRKVAASTNNGLLLALTEGDTQKVWVYQYYWQGNQKLQSSWGVWDFSGTGIEKVMSVEFIGDIAYFVNAYADGIYLETMDLSEGVIDAGEDFTVRIDRRVSEDQFAEAATYDPLSGNTTIKLPFALASSEGVAVVTRRGPNGRHTPYVSLGVVSAAGDTVVVKGDYAGADACLYVGLAYGFTYEFSRQYLKSGQEGAALQAGRLQLLRWHLSYSQSGYFTVEVLNGSRKHSYTFTGKVLGTASATVGSTALTDGTFAFRVGANAKNARVKIINNSFLPCYFTSAEWEGRFERNTSRA